MIEELFKLETRCLSSLSKVFADEQLMENAYSKSEAFRNETFSFQVAFCSNRRMKGLRVSVDSVISDQISVRSVGLVPSEMPIFEGHDDNLLRSTPGLYPDPLIPYNSVNGLAIASDQWRTVWITVKPNHQVEPGLYEIKVKFTTNEGDLLGSESFELDILPSSLPVQTLIHTEWFHTDCLATYYGVEVFSEEHWKLIEQYVKTAVEHGMNMLLTPLFTPPLDTHIGGERPTVQLVDVEKCGSSYQFGFSRLEKWVKLCSELGIQYFEFSHLFTQWGAKHAPKIIASEEGVSRRIFGWETDASGDGYTAFLSQLLPELVGFIREHKLEERSYFHVSDEPSIKDIDSYSKASEIIQQYVGRFPVIDALSDYEFYEKGLVKRPVPANNHIEPFLANNVPDLWTYYCCGQYKDVSNRFFSMPSVRNRIIGIQLYKFQIKGFLHWGYNFWYSQNSLKEIDPYKVTDAELSFPSGDAFLVYPGEDGPVESIRLEVFYEALQDLRALNLLESLIGREQVIELLEEGLPHPITFAKYPHDLEWLLAIRQKINMRIVGK